MQRREKREIDFDLRRILATNLNPNALPFNPETTHNITQQKMNQELQQQIGAMIAAALETQGRTLFNSLINTQAEVAVDEVIDPSHANKIEDLDKIPDVVKCLRDFSGDPTEFSSWRKNVERILKIYEPKKGTPKYFGILSVIRNKVTGNADQVLESYNTPLNWKAIVKCLTLHYADRRDIPTLEYQMTTLVQGLSSVEEFYQRVYSNLSLILNKISCSEFGSEAEALLTRTYRDKALDTFIRGLNGNLPSLLAMREPTDLPQALQLCLKLENQNFRSDHANNIYKTYVIPQQNQRTSYPQQNQRTYNPQQNQRTFNPQQNQRTFNPQQNQRIFYPQLAHLPRNHNVQTGFQPGPQPSATPRPFAQVRRAEVEPMEVDQTMLTRRSGYSNRNAVDAINTAKRPAGSSINAPRKQQRNYHLNTEKNMSRNNFYNNNVDMFEDSTEELNTNIYNANFLD